MHQIDLFINKTKTGPIPLVLMTFISYLDITYDIYSEQILKFAAVQFNVSYICNKCVLLLFIAKIHSLMLCLYFMFHYIF